MADFELQYLKHGKSLCGKVFGRFVETFNALVDFMNGLRGDAEGKNGEGHITYDRKNNIIRCDGCGGTSGGASGASAADLSASAFGLVEEKDDDGTVTGRTVVNCWWNQGGVTRTGANVDIGTAEGVVYLKVDATGMGGSGFEVAVGTLAGVQSLQQDPSLYVVPLYSITDGLVVDLRTAPQLQMVEFLKQ